MMRVLKKIVPFLFFGLISCGPIISTVKIVDAEIAIREAKQFSADEHAKYEYNMAIEYLKKAQEENAFAEFWGAEKFAHRSYDMAVQARKKSEIKNKVQKAPGEFESRKVVPLDNKIESHIESGEK